MNRAGPVVFKLVLLTVPLVSVFFIMPSAMSIGHQVAPPARCSYFHTRFPLLLWGNLPSSNPA